MSSNPHFQLSDYTLARLPPARGGGFFAVYGDTKKFKKELKNLGGIHLKDGPGWFFPGKNFRTLLSFLSIKKKEFLYIDINGRRIGTTSYVNRKRIINNY